MQGDVIGIVDENGKQVASYSYDAWGNIISQSGALAEINPIRYKGYYYDSDTGMYYLQSRYYDPSLHRFINADDPSLIVGLSKNSVIGANLFSYCENNGVNRVDYNGSISSSATLKRKAGSALTLLGILIVIIKFCGVSGSANSWNPVGWILLTVAGIALLAFGIWSLAKYFSDKALKENLLFINKASSSATPPPPNKGGKGTKTGSKTLYNKNGYRIDVENPGNRQGQIHIQNGKNKYIYNVKDQAFHIGKSNGKLAPKSIQKMLNDKDVIKAIAKGLKILGY